MDWFDLLPAPDLPGRPRTRAEDIGGGLGMVVLPCLVFLLVMFAGGWKHPLVAFGLLPAGSGVLTLSLARLLGTSASWSVRAAIGSVTMCLLASSAGCVLGVITSLWAGF